jgi:hypothetical protein
LAAQKEITLENKKTNKVTKEITEGSKKIEDSYTGLSLSFTEGLVPSTDFFNENLKLSGIFVNKINDGTFKLSDSFKVIKSDAELLKEKFAEIGHTIGSQISDALVGAINGTKSLGEAAKNIINDLANSLLRMGINTLLKSTGLGIFSNLVGFANGGRPPVGKPSIIGEKGPELFVPSTAGTIIPNNQLGNSKSGSVVVNVAVDASGSSVEGQEEEGRQLGRLIAAAVQSEIVQQKRPGGLLA